MTDTTLHKTMQTPPRRRPKGEPILRKSPQHRWNEQHRKELAAHAAVRVALRNGTLKRGKCEECGSLRVDAHHDDYDQPLQVRWLCRRHHQRLHARQRRQKAVQS